MSDCVRVRILRSVATLGGATAVLSLGIAVATWELEFWWRSFAGAQAAIALTYAVIVWLVAPRQPRNATVWAMSTSAGAAICAATLSLVPFATDDPLALLDPQWVPADLGGTVGWTLAVGNTVSVPGLFVPLTLGLIVFPDGRFPSRRWRRTGLVGAVSIGVLSITHGWWYRPGNDSGNEGLISFLALVTTAIVAVVAIGGLFVRFRRSTGSARLQYKWVVWGTGVGVLVFGGFAFLPDSAVATSAAPPLATAAAVVWAAAYGIAVGKYRLHEIDVVISRTVVYLSLAAMITGTYVLVVVVIGDFVGGTSIRLSVAATAVVALAFEPARSRLHHAANRLVYGRRETPYQILGDLTGRLSVVESSEALLTRLTEQLLAGTGARRVAVWRDDGGTLTPIAHAPADAPPPDPSTVRSATLDLPIEHAGGVIGRLTVEERAGAALRPADVRLAHDLAGSAALVVRKLRLDRDLAAAAQQVAESRRRLVGAQDDQLRRLERELNSGIEQQVVALGVQLRLAERAAVAEGTDRTAGILRGLGDDMRDAIEQIGLLAQGIYPPLLDTDGLARAIAMLAVRAPLEVRVDVDVSRLDAAVEGAVYFCVAEALTNAVKHGNGPVSIGLSLDRGALTFTVRDSGPGFDVASTPRGSGLHNMHDRLDALGGELSVTSRPGAATTITGRLPVDSEKPHDAEFATASRRRGSGA